MIDLEPVIGLLLVFGVGCFTKIWWGIRSDRREAERAMRERFENDPTSRLGNQEEP